MYKAGSDGPVVFCLHGGGYSGYAKSLVVLRILILSFMTYMLVGKDI